jgi:hypothetical protein
MRSKVDEDLTETKVRGQAPRTQKPNDKLHHKGHKKGMKSPNR